MSAITPQRANLLFWLGIAGVVFYMISPVLFPKVPNLRQPELLPVFTLMLGLGQLLKGNSGGEADAPVEPPKELPPKL